MQHKYAKKDSNFIVFRSLPVLVLFIQPTIPKTESRSSDTIEAEDGDTIEAEDDTL